MSHYFQQNAGQPRVGIRVLDLCRLLTGPVATPHPAVGPELIKIEDTGAGDCAQYGHAARAGDRRASSGARAPGQVCAVKVRLQCVTL